VGRRLGKDVMNFREAFGAEKYAGKIQILIGRE